MIVSLPLISYHKITGRYKAERLAKDYPIYEVGKIVDKIIPKKPMRITEQEEQSFKSATSCYTCGKKFRDIPGPDNKVRDHCHVLGM